MFKFLKRRSARKLRIVADPNATRADLQIRNLLDDPGLRKAMGLNLDGAFDLDLDFDLVFDLDFDLGRVLEPSAA